MSRYEEPPFTRSDLEGLLSELCDRHALPRPAVNVTLAGCEGDFLWANERLIVETDGRADHLTRQVRYERRYVPSVLKGVLQPEPDELDPVAVRTATGVDEPDVAASASSA